MKYHPIYLALLLISSTLVGADSTSLLSHEKQTILHQQQIIYESEHEKLRTNWFSPINLGGSYNYDKNPLGVVSDTQQISASFSQDIFRSGGITYQIAYADTLKAANAINHQQNIAALNLQLFHALLNYQKSSLAIKQSKQRVANYEIEVFIKRQLFDAGKTDISELNNALMKKSGELKTLASLKYTQIDHRQEIAKLSDIDPDVFILPHFDLLTQKEYTSAHWDIQYANAQSKTQSYLSDLTKSNYSPSLTLSGTIGYQNYHSPDTAGYKGNYYGTGLSLALPFTYNASATIQQAQTTHLQSIAKISDKQREVEREYLQSISLIENYRETINLIRENLKLYDDLIGVIEAGVRSGIKTGYDLQTLKNTKSIEELEISINEINIQIELAKLHFSTSPSKEPL